jgi:hypothetical protein
MSVFVAVHLAMKPRRLLLKLKIWHTVVESRTFGAVFVYHRTQSVNSGRFSTFSPLTPAQSGFFCRRGFARSPLRGEGVASRRLLRFGHDRAATSA